MTERPWIVHGLWVSVLVAGVAGLSLRPFQSLDLKAYDAIVQTAGRVAPSNRVALVVVDDKSLGELGQWPWPRPLLAKLVGHLRALGASVIAFDVLLAEPDRTGSGRADADPRNGLSAGDAELAATIGGSDVVMGHAFTFTGDDPNAACALHPIDAAIVTRPEGNRSDRLFHPTAVVCSLPELTRTAGASGFLNIGLDVDSRLRRLPLLMNFGGQLHPSLALAAIRRASPLSRLSLSSGSIAELGLTLGDREIPLDSQGAMLLRFRGPAHTFAHLSVADLFHARVSREAVEGRIVFVGATALGVRDVVATPHDSVYPGIEVHATAADNLLRGDVAATPAYARAFDVLASVAAGMAAALLLGGATTVARGLAAAALLLALWAASSLILRTQSVFLSPLFPSIAVAGVFGVVSLVSLRMERARADSEGRRRRQAYEFIVESLTSMTETRDAATGLHARRTQAYARLLAKRLSRTPRFRKYLTADAIDAVAFLAALHDIGKVGVADSILLKPSALSDDERSEMRKHPGFGYATITKAESQVGMDSAADMALLLVAKDIVYTHHERWDGNGYPRGIAGDDIPIPGRIVAVVDVYDALVETRPYRGRLTHDEAVAIISKGRGTQFDPDVVDAFVSVESEFHALWVTFHDEKHMLRVR